MVTLDNFSSIMHLTGKIGKFKNISFDYFIFVLLNVFMNMCSLKLAFKIWIFLQICQVLYFYVKTTLCHHKIHKSANSNRHRKTLHIILIHCICVLKQRVKIVLFETKGFIIKMYRIYYLLTFLRETVIKILIIIFLIKTKFILKNISI